MNEKLPSVLILEQSGVPYRIFRHAKAPDSLEQAAAERGQRPEQIIRSILFRIARDQFVLVLVAGPGQISWSKLRRQLSVSRISMASEGEVLQVAGAPVGAVGPFGLSQPVRILADRSVFLPDEVSIGSGLRGAAILLKSSDLRKALGDVEIGDLI